MELIFDHTLGKQENQDLVICKPLAFVDMPEETEALDTGWLALDHPVMNKEVFYQSRSTRIDLQKYKPRYKSHKWQDEDIGVKIIDASEMVKLLGLPQIYKQYMKRKKFKMFFELPEVDMTNNKSLLFAKAENVLEKTFSKPISFPVAVNVELSIARLKAEIGFLFTAGLNLTRNSAARCCASAADPPFPQSIILPPDLIQLTMSLIITNNIANYIDPNAGSAIAAAVIAALAGVGITVKMYWEKLKFKLAKND